MAGTCRAGSSAAVRRRRSSQRPSIPKNSFQNNLLVRSPLLCVTVCNTMASNTHDPAELGQLEREVLSIIWRCGSVTAERVREELDRPLKDSTVRTVLRRLEEKGYLAHSVEDRAFIYRPVQSRQRGAGRAGKRRV